MTIGELLRYSYLRVAAGSFNCFHTGSTILGSLFGTIETSVPDEVITVPGKAGRSVAVHVYLNEAAKKAKAERRPCVTYITLHGTGHFHAYPKYLLVYIGGGFILKRHGHDAGFISHLLQSPVLESIPLIILDSDYPHAPEYPFPAPIEDISSLVAYVQAHPDLYDPAKLLIGGFSAGANIALGVSTVLGEEAIRANKPHPIQGVIAFYPPIPLDNRQLNPEIPQPPHSVPGIIIPQRMIDFFMACYFRNSPDPDADKRKPYASPIFAEVGTFPSKILLITCEYDPLRVVSGEFKAKLETEGDGKIDVRGREVKGVGHGWDGMMMKEGEPGWKGKVESYDDAAKLVREVATS